MAISDPKIIAATTAVKAYLNNEAQADATVAIPAAIYHQLDQLYRQLHLLFGPNDGESTPPNTVNQPRRRQA
jgi:hypothetical protein